MSDSESRPRPKVRPFFPSPSRGTESQPAPRPPHPAGVRRTPRPFTPAGSLPGVRPASTAPHPTPVAPTPPADAGVTGELPAAPEQAPPASLELTIESHGAEAAVSHAQPAPGANSAQAAEEAAPEEGAASTAGAGDRGAESWWSGEDRRLHGGDLTIDEAVEESLTPSSEAAPWSEESAAAVGQHADDDSGRPWFDEEESEMVAEAPAAEGTILFEERLDEFSSLPTHAPSPEPVMSNASAPEAEEEQHGDKWGGVDANAAEPERAADYEGASYGEPTEVHAPAAAPTAAETSSAEVTAYGSSVAAPDAYSPIDASEPELPDAYAAPPEDTLSALSGEFGEPPSAAEEEAWSEPADAAGGTLVHSATHRSDDADSVTYVAAAGEEGGVADPVELERLEQLKEVEPWAVAAPEPTEPNPGAGIAEALERVARRVREGTLVLPADSESATDETALAMALAALLRQGGAGR